MDKLEVFWPVPLPPQVGKYLPLMVLERDNQAPQRNDFLVTHASALLDIQFLAEQAKALDEAVQSARQTRSCMDN